MNFKLAGQAQTLQPGETREFTGKIAGGTPANCNDKDHDYHRLIKAQGTYEFKWLYNQYLETTALDLTS